MVGAQEPTAEQAAVIGAPLAPMAVIAGAGSGKSETMAARLVWLVANQMVSPGRVLGLTFTRKAAAELAGRVTERLTGLRGAGRVFAGSAALPGPGEAGIVSDGAEAGDPVISTYHSYAGRLVGDHALREGLEPSLRLITPAVSWQLAARVVAAYDGAMDSTDWTPATVTYAVLTLAGEMAEHLRGPADVLEVGEWLDRCHGALGGRVPKVVRDVLRSQRVREQLLPLVAAYAAAKSAREVIDYGDQMAIAARIAARHPAVSLTERARYQVILLDEYQDTSHAQLVLLRSLFGEGHPVPAVGDPCQSIYGWRGASAGTLDRFPAEFVARDGRPARELNLTTSWRNRPEILDVANALSRPLRAHGARVAELAPSDPLAEPASVATVHCALLSTYAEEAGWLADRVLASWRLAAGVEDDTPAYDI